MNSLPFTLRTLLKTLLVTAMIIAVILYPFVLRDFIFDNLPRDWTLSYFKSITLALSFTTAILSAVLFLIMPLRRKMQVKRDYKSIIEMLALISLLFVFFFNFWRFYNNDRAWISADFFSKTGQEIEMSTIGDVMGENEILGFHYRALFLKMFHITFFPFGIILPVIFLALGEFIERINLTMSLVAILLLLLVFLCFGVLLYG